MKVQLNIPIANCMCRIKGFRIGPFISSFGLKFPFDFDFRRLCGDKKALKLIGQKLGKVIRKYNVDLIAGGETAGIFIAASVALYLNKGMLYIRKKPKGHGVPRQIEGVFKKGQTVALVDDTLYTGNQKKLFTQILEKHGLKVKVIATLAGSKEKKYDWMKKKNIRLHYLCERKALRQYMWQKGAIPDEVYHEAEKINRLGKKWRKWTKNQNNWQRIYQMRKKYKDLID